MMDETIVERDTVLIGRNPVRSPDFSKILTQFQWYYCKNQHPCPKGDNEYYNWLNSLGLDETKPYGQSKEAFRWAKDMISLTKEDESSKTYKVLAAFPVESMNMNVYTEAELRKTGESLKGVVPNLNHKDYWVLQDPKHPEIKAEFIGSKYEDGAVEALLKVPKTLMCPDCTKGKTICDLIGEKKIVNVSLEAECDGGYDGYCKGMRLTGCALLTVETLPGIPLARIFPIERFIPVKTEAKKKLKIQIITTAEGKAEVAPAPLKKEDNPEVPAGMVWDGDKGMAVPACPDGQEWDVGQNRCVPIGFPKNNPSDAEPALAGKPATNNSTRGRSPAPEAADIGSPDSKTYLKKMGTDDKNPSGIKPNCPEGMVYDEDENKCIPQGNVEAGSAKPGKGDVGNVPSVIPGNPQATISPGKVPNTDGSTRWIKTDTTCPEGTVWNDETQTCIPQSMIAPIHTVPPPKGNVRLPNPAEYVLGEDYVEDRVDEVDFKPTADWPDSCFLWVPDIAKGPKGKKSARKLPVKFPDGTVSEPNVRNALSRLSQTIGIPAQSMDAIRSKLQAMLKKINPDYKPTEAYYFELSDAQVRAMNAENSQKSAELKYAELEKKYHQTNVENMQLKNKVEAIEPLLAERDKQYLEASAKATRAQTEQTIAQEDAAKRITDTIKSRDEYKKQFEDFIVKNTDLDKKYQTQLTNNLELTRSITEKNESLLKLSKDSDALRKQFEVLTAENAKLLEDLSKAKRFGKVIAKI